MTNAKIAAAFAPQPGKSTTVKLLDPITRANGELITEITLRKPNAGELRGLKVPDLVNGDINSVLAVIPRVSSPLVAVHEAEQLSTEDIGEIAGAFWHFFLSSTDRAKIEQMQA